MASTVADLTPSELRNLIEEVVREQLMDWLGDPDEGLELRNEVHERLAAQLKRVANGERGTSISDVPRPPDA